MTRRPIAIAGLVLALLYGAWGNVVAAAFCPRFSDHSCCPKHSEHSSAPTASHHAHYQSEPSSSAEDNGMGECAAHKSESESAVVSHDSGNSSVDVAEFSPALAPPVEDQSCTHCLTHSQPARGRFSISSDESNRTSDAEALPITKLPLALHSFAKLLPSYDHGPPGQSHPLFVLHSVFRI